MSLDRKLEEKFVTIGQLVGPIMSRPGMTRGEATDWAKAMALVAGYGIGLLHKAMNVPAGQDEVFIHELQQKVAQGVGIGRKR